jgi:hypothetical protein
MKISMHTTTDTDAALADVRAAGQPLGILAGDPVVDGDSIAIALWPSTAPGRFRLIRSLTGVAGGAPNHMQATHMQATHMQATHMQVVAFDGPRTAEWAAAEERAGEARIWPAVRDLAGVHRVLLIRADDNATLVVMLADGVAAIDEAVRAIRATTLLPGEDPALLTGPDRVAVYRLRHADLPDHDSMMEA